MTLSTYPPKPDWLTDDKIKEFKQELKECPNPYTEEELSELEYDGDVDIERHNAYVAREILEHFGFWEN